MKIRKTQFILLLVGAFIAGMVLSGGVAAYQLNAVPQGDDKMQSLKYYIENYYYTDYPAEEELMEGAYKGYVQALGDPYSAYMTPEEYESFNVSTSGEYSGVGIIFSEDEKGNFVVLSIISGSPAEKAGFKEGDILLTVDGKSFHSADTMAAEIRGKKGTEVTLEYSRNGNTKSVTMVREKISQESVEHEMLEDQVGYIYISAFNEDTGAMFKEALKDVTAKGAKSLVLDLRNNGGGLVDECIKVADEFLDEGVVCYVRDARGNRDSYKAEDGKTDLETVVLVNGNSASASEILAGALQDNGFTLIGKKTFGKGIIQAPFEMEDGSAIKLTIMDYLSPKERVIHGKGLKPDIIIKNDKNTDVDEQLEKALEILK